MENKECVLCGRKYSPTGRNQKYCRECIPILKKEYERRYKKKIRKNTYLVYKHVNKINGKIYVGQTHLKPEERWIKGKGYKSNTYFYNAIQKYGWDNFEHKILIHGLTKEQADRWEKKLIKKWNLINRDRGYNLKEGGSNGKHSIEALLKISKNNARWYLGKNLKEETKQKIKDKSKKKPVMCIETGKIFESIHEAGKTLNISIPHISTVCKGNTQRKIAGGYHWAYLHKEQNKTPDYVDVKKKIIKCLETGEIFNSIMEASRIKKIERTVISDCINSENKLLTAGGYHWVKLDKIK